MSLPRSTGPVRLRPDELVYAWMGAPATPMQIALLGIFDAGPFLRPDGTLDAPRIRDELTRRAVAVPALRRRVVWTRPGEGRPVWVADPTFDPLAHVVQGTLPPGADLPTWAAGRAARGLPQDRPLWRAEVVDGLPDREFAVLIVVSHVLADGLAGVALAGSLLDQVPDAVVPAAPATPVPPPPTHRELLRLRWAEVAAALLRPRARSAAPARPRPGLRQFRDATASFAGPEPVTGLPRRIGPARRMAVVRTPLDELRRTGAALGATVNDLLLTAVAGGLRTLLAKSGRVDPELVLRATVPAALPGTGHQVMAMLVVGLPVGEPDPLRRLARIHRTTTAGKARLRTAAGDLADRRLPALVGRWVLRATRRFGSHRLTLSVTDVPGPATPLWLAGARLLDAVPIAPMSPFVPLSVAALSYAGELSVSINADAATSGVDLLAEGTARSFAELVERARAGAGLPPR